MSKKQTGDPEKTTAAVEAKPRAAATKAGVKKAGAGTAKPKAETGKATAKAAKAAPAKARGKSASARSATAETSSATAKSRSAKKPAAGRARAKSAASRAEPTKTRTKTAAKPKAKAEPEIGAEPEIFDDATLPEPETALPAEEIAKPAEVAEAKVPESEVACAAEKASGAAEFDETATPVSSATDEEEKLESSVADDHPPARLERLQKILSQAGIASRRRAEEMIVEGRVVVNGQIVTQLGAKADPERDHIRVDGKLIHGAERHRTYLLNKPKGYMTTVSDPEGRPTVMEFFSKIRERLYPVGRLDYQSEGLLLVTNDGELANLLTHAGSGVEKTYLVKVAGQPTEDEIERLRRGVEIEREQPGSARVRTVPAGIRLIRPGENPWFEVTLIEGRNRELRKLFAEVGHYVEKIRRVAYGPLALDVEPGSFRELTAEEVAALRLMGEGKMKPRRLKIDHLLPKEAGGKAEPRREEWRRREWKPGLGGPQNRQRNRPAEKQEGFRRDRNEQGGRPAQRFNANFRSQRPFQKESPPEEKRPRYERPFRNERPSEERRPQFERPFREQRSAEGRRPRFERPFRGGKPAEGTKSPSERPKFDRSSGRSGEFRRGRETQGTFQPRGERRSFDRPEEPRKRFEGNAEKDAGGLRGRPQSRPWSKGPGGFSSDRQGPKPGFRGESSSSARQGQRGGFKPGYSGKHGGFTKPGGAGAKFKSRNPGAKQPGFRPKPKFSNRKRRG